MSRVSKSFPSRHHALGKEHVRVDALIVVLRKRRAHTGDLMLKTKPGSAQANHLLKSFTQKSFAVQRAVTRKRRVDSLLEKLIKVEKGKR